MSDTGKHLDDDELIREILVSKDPKLYGILYDRYISKVYHKCLSLVNNKAIAQDLAHDIFLKTYLNLAKFNFKASFSTWIYRITFNYCIDYLRKNQQRKETSELPHNISEDDDIKNEEQLLNIKAHKLKIVLERLKIDDKAILLIKYQDDKSIKEMMDILDLSESAVKMRIKRARARAVEIYKQLDVEE